ncbi:MAG: HD domain-containing protein [Lachnospiraceae bacterium]|nr:HD domain-containing protein [Lachnospiraceae bacterium]
MYRNGRIVRAGKRTAKARERWINKYERVREVNRQIRDAAPDILHSANFNLTKAHLQHGNVTVNAHCLNVAKYSVALCHRLHISCSETELIRGALLHDYFLYDWHDNNHISPLHLHGFYHPGRALRNADREYRLTEIEREIIRKHMWPLTIVPPTCREAWIVSMADKWCSAMETAHIHKGHGKISAEVRKYLEKEAGD